MIKINCYNSKLHYAEIGQHLAVYDVTDKVLNVYNKNRILVRRYPNLRTANQLTNQIKLLKLLYEICVN